MAELIPLEYRIRVARSQLISRWAMVLVVTAGVAGAVLLSTHRWTRFYADEFARREQVYRKDAVAIQQHNELRARRQELAGRMKKLEDLRNDKVLLSLLNSASSAFSEFDSLEYVCIDAHPAEKKTGDSKYSVRVRGITTNDTTHSRLLERLTEIGRAAQPPVKVPLGEKHLSDLFDGEVTSFDITCDQPLAKGG